MGRLGGGDDHQSMGWGVGNSLIMDTIFVSCSKIKIYVLQIQEERFDNVILS